MTQIFVLFRPPGKTDCAWTRNHRRFMLARSVRGSDQSFAGSGMPACAGIAEVVSLSQELLERAMKRRDRALPSTAVALALIAGRRGDGEGLSVDSGKERK